jgi:predicted regulator of Ras-like GTPase activity (Roadblock/LC7/MglB family)
MPATPIVTMEAATRLLEALEAFLDESEASFSLVIDRGGAVLSQAGRVPDNIDPTIVGALGAGSFAATKELAARVGEEEFTSLHQQGARAQILMSSVDSDVVLITVFDERTTLGLVKFYSARVVKRIAAVLIDLRSATIEAPIFSEQDLNSAPQLYTTTKPPAA